MIKGEIWENMDLYSGEPLFSPWGSGHLERAECGIKLRNQMTDSLGVFNVLEKDNERVRVTNHQFKAN